MSRLSGPMIIAGAVLFASIALGGQDRPQVIPKEARRLPDVAGAEGGPQFRAVAPRDPKAPKPDLDAAPKSVPIRLSGVVRDLDGNPIAGATVYALGTQILDDPRLTVETKLAATTKTAKDGSYSFAEVSIPTSRTRHTPQAASPYVRVKVLAKAPGLAIGWHADQAMYATNPADPDDIQGYLALGSPFAMDVMLRPEADLQGRVVDESGKPVVGAKVRVADVNLLDEQGLETTVGINMSPESWPAGLGMAETGEDGRFRLPGLPSESCSWLFFTRPGNAQRTLYASTSAESETNHGQPREHNARSPHPVFPKDMTVSMPSTRKIEVRVVAGDDGKPAPGIRVNSMGETLATGFYSGGVSDANGRLTLELPAGKYTGLCADPASTDSRFVRTYLRPFVVPVEPKVQSLEYKMKPGCEVLLQAVDAETGKGVPGVQFQIKPNEPDGRWNALRTSTFYVGKETTGPDGKLRAVLDPVEGKTYQIRVLSTGQDDLVRPGPPPNAELAYNVIEKESDPFDRTAGASFTIRFKLEKK